MFIRSSVLKKIIHQTGIFGNFLVVFEIIVCENMEFIQDTYNKKSHLIYGNFQIWSLTNSIYHRLLIISAEYLDLTIVYLKSECFVPDTFIYFLYFIAMAILFQIPCMPSLYHFSSLCMEDCFPRCPKILQARNPFIKAELACSRQLLSELRFNKAVAKFCIQKCLTFCQDAKNV